MNPINEIKKTVAEDVRDVKDAVKGEIQHLKREDPVTRPLASQREGTLSRSIEQQTAKIPSDVFLWGALAVTAVAIVCEVTDRKEKANFFGHWVPAILTLGVYNKLVKLRGSDGA